MGEVDDCYRLVDGLLVVATVLLDNLIFVFYVGKCLW